MQKASIMKAKFSQTNNKRFSSPNAITSLPIGHPSLNKLTQYKEEKGEKIEKHFLDEKNNLLRMENKAFLSNERLSIYQQILSQNFKYYFFDQDDDKKYVDSENLKTNLAQTTENSLKIYSF